jgi:hypothetical protein
LTDRHRIENLRACGAPADLDRVLIFDQRGPDNRLAAGRLAARRAVLGIRARRHRLDPGRGRSVRAGQVDAVPHELLASATRAQTLSDHLQLVTHLKWRRVDIRRTESVRPLAT